MKSLQGHLLVASPHLPDPNFYHTVVLMVKHHEQGALGVVLNRPSRSPIQAVIAKVSDVSCAAEDCVRIGGPIEGPLMAVHGLPLYSEAEVLPGIYFATQREHILQVVRQDSSPFLLFSGYAGWSGGQLENELKLGGWLSRPASTAYVFQTAADQLWKKVTGDIGTGILDESLKLKHIPDDPSLN